MARPRQPLTSLPPGQHAIDGFPRYGTHFWRPVPDLSGLRAIRVDGAVRHPVDVALGDLATMPRQDMVSDFHCVAGWTARDVEWGGVPFRTLYESVIAPVAMTGVSHVRFVGIDGFRSVLLLEDALGDDVMVADRLDGAPLGPDHGGPARLVCPSRYGYKNTKHLASIELHTGEPAEGHADPLVNAGLQLVKPHPRARVAEEERHRYVPGWTVRWLNFRVIHPVLRYLCRRGDRPRH